jgi:REP element-mobilizing transposase RayT
MKKLPCRKNQRLAGHDYSQSGYYFITFCTHNKNGYLGYIIAKSVPDPSGKEMVLNENGLIVESIIRSLEDRFDNILVEQYCIMPNHVHMIIDIINNSSEFNVGAVHEPPADNDETSNKSGIDHRSLISNVIGYLKMNSAKQIRLKNSTIRVVWQRGYNDRIIRNGEEHWKIREYIRTNPRRGMTDVLCDDEMLDCFY